jgi:long-subunit fatty acid transport protein
MRALFVFACFLPATALAGGYFIPNPNPRELALVQSAVAAQNGPEAVSENVAALAGQQGLAISAAGQMLANKSSWHEPGLGAAETRNGPVYPPAIYAAYGDKLPNGMPYGFGVGFHVLGGGSMEWPAGWGGSTRIQKVTQNVFQTTAGLGVQVVPQLKLGASLIYYRLVVELQQQVGFSVTFFNVVLVLGGGGFGFGVGAEAAIPDVPLTFGASFRYQGSFTLSGNAHFDNVPAAFGVTLLDQGAKSDMTVPSELFLGLAWRATDDLRVTGAWSWENWSKYKQDQFIGDKKLEITVPREFVNAYVIRLGAEYEKVASLPLTLRLGGMRSVSDQPSTTVSPTLLDAPSWSVSAGVGYEIVSGLRADVAYQYTWFDKLSATESEAFPGSYKTWVHFLSIGLTYRAKL